MDDNLRKAAHEAAIFTMTEIMRATIDKICMRHDAKILKIGVAGAGHLSRLLIEHAPNGSILSIDTSAEPIEEYEENTRDMPNFTVRKIEPNKIDYHNEFDFVFSFMSLVFQKNPLDIYQKIYEALKPGGDLLLVIPSRDSPFFGTLQQVVASGQMPELEGLSLPFDVDTLDKFEDELARVPFSSFHIEAPETYVRLPSLQTFRSFLDILAYHFKEQLPHETIVKMFDAQTAVFDKVCQDNHKGKYIFEFTPYIIKAVK